MGSSFPTDNLGEGVNLLRLTRQWLCMCNQGGTRRQETQKNGGRQRFYCLQAQSCTVPGGARQRKQKRLVSASLHEADGAAAGVRRS